MSTDDQRGAAPHQVSVVIPVYKGEASLPGLMAELAELTTETVSPGGTPWIVSEVILVFDNGPDGSAATIRALETQYDFVRGVWLSRNFGQHSATLAGMASSGFEWIATIDEDGQHNPTDIGTMIDAALEKQAHIVYGKPTNVALHGPLRNAASRSAKWVVSLLAGSGASHYQSFRLIVGEVGRSVAAYAGSGVYLDVALGWVAGWSTTAPVELREGRRASGYSTRKLVGHFWRLILSSGTRGLRVVSFAGVLFAITGVVMAVVFVIERLTNGNLPAGFASLMVVLLITSGAVLFALGIIAEYLGVAVSMAMGKPPYLIVSDPNLGPLGRRPPGR